MHTVKRGDWEKRIADLDKRIESEDKGIADMLRFVKSGMMFSVNVSHEIQIID